MILHERMKEIQADSDMKIKTLAGQFGVSANSLGNYLNGKRAIPYELVGAFAQYFHVTTDYLMGLTDDPKPPFPVSGTERILLERYRGLSREQKELITQNVDFMLQQNQR